MLYYFLFFFLTIIYFYNGYINNIVINDNDDSNNNNDNETVSIFQKRFNFQGDITAYTNQISNGYACGFTSFANSVKNTPHLFVAMNNLQYENGLACGRCIEVGCVRPIYPRQKCTNKIVKAIIVDKCPECGYGSVDLTNDIYATITNVRGSVFKGKFNFIDCGSPLIRSGGVKFYFKPQSNQFYVALQPRDFKNGVRYLLINGKRMPQQGGFQLFFIAPNGGQNIKQRNNYVTIVDIKNSQKIYQFDLVKPGAEIKPRFIN